MQGLDYTMVAFTVLSRGIERPDWRHLAKEDDFVNGNEAVGLVNQMRTRYQGGAQLSFAREFAQDLTSLCPLSRLEGKFVCKDAKKKLPTLANIEKDSCDEELQYIVEELLNPGDGLMDCQSWKCSRLRFHAIVMIVKHLNSIEAPEIAAYMIDQLG